MVLVTGFTSTGMSFIKYFNDFYYYAV